MRRLAVQRGPLQAGRVHPPAGRAGVLAGGSAFVLSLVVAACFPACAAAVAERRPAMVVGETFQWVPGAWAEYRMRETASNTVFRFRFAVLDVDDTARPRSARIEFDIGPTNAEPLVMRMRVEKTAAGPGRALEAVMQIPGADPVAIPRGDLDRTAANPAAGTIERFTATRRSGWTNRQWRGRTLAVAEVRAANSGGVESLVLMSTNVPPLGIVSATAPGMELTLEDWGGGAQSRIRGEPIGFWRWLWRGLAGSNQKNKH